MLFTCSATQLRRKESFAQLRMLRFKPHSWKCRSPLLTSSDDPQTVWVRRRPLKNHRVVKLKRNFTNLHNAAPENEPQLSRCEVGCTSELRLGHRLCRVSQKSFEDFEVSTQQELKAGVAHWIGVKLLLAAGCETVNPKQSRAESQV